jgi:CheY-like chemotaxis protein
MKNVSFKIGFLDNEEDYLNEMSTKIEQKLPASVVKQLIPNDPTVLKNIPNWLKEQNIDLLISDNRMNEIDSGINLVKSVRKENILIPIIILTAFPITADNSKILIQNDALGLDKDDGDENVIKNIELLLPIMKYSLEFYQHLVKELTTKNTILRMEREALKFRLLENSHDKIPRKISAYFNLLFATSIVISIFFKYDIIKLIWSQLGFFLSLGTYFMTIMIERHLKNYYRNSK